MLKKILASFVAVLMIGGIFSPMVMAETGSSRETVIKEREFEKNGVKYKQTIEIEYGEDGSIKKKVKIEGPDGKYEYKEVRSIDGLKTEEEVKQEDFDEGTVIEEKKRCAQFEDVDVQDKLCKYLHKAKTKSVVSPNGRFYSNAPVSRAQFAGMVVRAFQLEADITQEEAFADVEEDNTFYNQIMILKALDIASGAVNEEGTRYFPNMPISRGQAIKILVNTLEVTDNFEFEDGDMGTIIDKFKDENLEQDVFAEYIIKLYASEDKMPEVIVKGYSDGYIRTGRFISRLEATVMIMRAMWAAGLVDEIGEVDPVETGTGTEMDEDELDDDDSEDDDEDDDEDDNDEDDDEDDDNED